MKRVVMGTVFAIAAVAAFAAVPSVSNVAMVQDSATRTVTISYDLADAPAIVTFDVRTNGVSIGTVHLDYAAGDVHREVQPATGRKIMWQADKAWPDQTLNVAGAEAVVTAWPLEAPPPYMVLNLVNTNDVRHYATPWELPGGGVTNDLYKTDYLVLRYIAAKNVEWTMGSATNAPGVVSSSPSYDGRLRETAHLVTLTNDFYIGVYELTQGQWFRVKGAYKDNASYTEEDRDVHPADGVSWTDLRGMTAGMGWPANDEVDSGQFFGMLRAYSGMRFDLPTEAQWEYACRAGTMSGINNGYELVGFSANSELLKPLAVFTGSRAGASITSPVGTKEPNAWGLYDMHGNIWEWCLDRLADDTDAAFEMPPDAVIDPLGAETGDYRVRRGGCMDSAATYCRSPYRSKDKATKQSVLYGFRVALRIP
ncbi:MAG: formylglycine-generating enzyme family protein [Kiritimatiellae bacterium]|nr:formylglycine-generating enzyme family protein [Kiritimatiellia bacterium]